MRPFTLLIKPAGPDCNLDCKYCFYASRQRLFGDRPHRMSEHVLDNMIADYLSLRLPVSSFAWQGGEPTLMGLNFFQQVVALQKQYGRPGQVVSNALQTNALLLDDNWCRFLHEYRFLVGISLDGPQPLHDHYRVNRNGQGSFAQVMAAIDTCRRHEVEFNILVLLNDLNVKASDELFDFFVGNDFRFLQFIPCVEKDPHTGAIADFAVRPADYGEFLCRIFDRWLQFGPTNLSIRLFDSMLSYYATGRHSNCTFAARCDDYVVVEHNGDVFCCDFFVDDDWRLGNILETPVAELFASDKKHTFARHKRPISGRCLACRHRRLCRGGCLKDRAVVTGDFSEPSYFCAAYKRFFDYSQPQLLELARQLRRPPSQS